ncbi:MAG: tetratricopeptide repeat protein [Bacteroidales bacterium]|nr:tetratricopeptide repeat protein [Bacteroidales bacterium]
MSKNTNASHDGFESVEEVLSKTEKYIEENRKSLTIIIAAIAVVVGGYLGYKKMYIEPKDNDAQAEMFMAERYFEQDSFRLALEGDGQYYGFIDIIDEFGFTKTANLANYYAGICFLRLGEFEEAVEYLEQFDGNDRLVAPIALGATGDAYVELGNLKKGVKYYEKAALLNENNMTSPIYLFKAGLAYEELGDAKKAVQAYEKIKYKFPQSDEAKEIEKYITAAKMKL